MDIKEIVSKLNSKEMTRTEVAKSVGISGSTLTRYLRDAGYKYDNSAKQYELASSITETQEEIKLENKQYRKKENKPANKTEKQEENKPLKKVTYEIEEHLHDELKIMAVRQKRKVSEIVEAAIRQYLTNE